MEFGVFIPIANDGRMMSGTLRSNPLSFELNSGDPHG